MEDFESSGGDAGVGARIMRKVRTVVKDGKVFDVGEVDRELGVLP